MKRNDFTYALDAFLEAESVVEEAILSSTRASWAGRFYYLELLVDGDYRIVDGIVLGNLYDSPGVLIGIPPLEDEEFDEDEDLCFFDNCIDIIVDKFEDYWD